MRLTSRPAPPLTGEFTPPGDKSITHRAWLLGLLRAGVTRVVNANPGDDCAASRRCAAALGARVEADRIEGGGPLLEAHEAEDVLDCGNSGTTLRLLAGILAAAPIYSVLTGDASLRSRPVARVVEPLRQMGAQVWGRDGGRRAPIAIRGGGLEGIRHRSEVASAQVLSCLLLAGLGAEGRTEVTLPGPARDHTERMLAAFGVRLEVEPMPNGGRRVALAGPQALASGDRTIVVPGDFSAAAFFVAAAAAREGARVTVRGVNLNPTRTGLLEVLELMGARVERTHLELQSNEEVGDVTVIGARLHGVEPPPEWLPRWVDEVPAWTVAAALAGGRSRLTGAGELRVKETDRIAALTRGLVTAGIEARELEDGIEIEGGFPAGGALSAAGDHRLAMAFALLGAAAHRPVVVDDARSIATSYPGFAADFGRLGGSLALEEVPPA